MAKLMIICFKLSKNLKLYYFYISLPDTVFMAWFLRQTSQLFLSGDVIITKLHLHSYICNNLLTIFNTKIPYRYETIILHYFLTDFRN